MSDMSKISPDRGVTIYNLKDANARANKWDKSAQKVAGAYNLLDITAVSSVLSPATITVNADKFVRVVIPAQSVSGFVSFPLCEFSNYTSIPSNLKDVNLRLVGSPGGSWNGEFYLSLLHNGSTVAYDSGEGDNFIIPSSNPNSAYTLMAHVEYPTNGSVDVTFKPMITPDLLATYDDYVPYVPSNRQLKGEIDALGTAKMNNIFVKTKSFDITIPTTSYYAQYEINVVETGAILLAPLYAAANRGKDQIDFFVAKKNNSTATVTVVTLNRQNPSSAISVDATLTYLMVYI